MWDLLDLAWRRAVQTGEDDSNGRTCDEESVNTSVLRCGGTESITGFEIRAWYAFKDDAKCKKAGTITRFSLMTPLL